VSDARTQKTGPAEPGPAFPRTHHVLWLEFGNREDFDDPRREWRRLFSELLGTFALVMVAAGGGLLHAKGQISLTAAVVAPGLMVTAVILFMGAVSGAHLNPAVSLAFALRGDFPWHRVPGYILIQLTGATLACLFLRLVFGNTGHLGATLPGPGYTSWQALLMEIVLTALLVSVILGTASAAQNVGAIAALGVGGYIALAGLWAAPVSGVSMNPARSFGPALVSGDWTSYWVYAAGPIAGTLIAVGCALVLRGRGGDVISRAAGSGVLDEGALAAKAKLPEENEQGKVPPDAALIRERGVIERHALATVRVPAQVSTCRYGHVSPSADASGKPISITRVRPGRPCRPAESGARSAGICALMMRRFPQSATSALRHVPSCGPGSAVVVAGRATRRHGHWLSMGGQIAVSRHAPSPDSAGTSPTWARSAGNGRAVTRNPGDPGRGHGGFSGPAARESLTRGWHADGLAVRPARRMIQRPAPRTPPRCRRPEAYLKPDRPGGYELSRSSGPVPPRPNSPPPTRAATPRKIPISGSSERLHDSW
jgi:aquaporin Z